MFLNIFSEKWPFSDLKNLMGFMVIEKLYEKHLTPARYRELHFGQTKKTSSYSIRILLTLATEARLRLGCKDNCKRGLDRCILLNWFHKVY